MNMLLVRFANPIVNSNIIGIINSVLTPYMLNPTAWDWGNYAGFFWVRSQYPLRLL